MAVLYTNNASTLLTASISDAATSFSVTAGTGSLFPVVSGSDYFYITLADNAGNYEIVKVTGRSTDTFTITRGQDGTSARAFSVGDKVELRIVRAMLDALKGERLPLTGGTLTGILNISPNFGINTSTVDFGAVVKFDNSYSDVARGPNKVVLYNDVGIWLSGLGIHNNTLAVYSGGLTTFYSGTTGYNAVGTATLSFDASSISYKGNALLHAGNYTDYAAPASHTHSYLPLSGGTLSGKLIAGSSDGDSIEVRNDTASAASSGYITFKNKNGIGVYRPAARISGVNVDNAYDGDFLIETYSGGVAYKGLRVDENSNVLFYDTSGNVKFQWDSVNSRALINSNVVLHAGNYNSYSPTLTGGNASGTWGINITGTSSALATTGLTTFDYPGYVRPYWSKIAHLNFECNAIIDIQVKTDYNYVPYLYCRASIASWNGSTVSVKLDCLSSYDVGFFLYVDNNNDIWVKTDAVWHSYMVFNVVYNDGATVYTSSIATLTSAPSNSVVIGPGQQVRGTYGSMSSATPQNTQILVGSVNARGDLYANNGSTVLHAGNYGSYALPLSGGTLSGGLTVNNSTINVPSGYVSNGNPWGTSNSAFFPNGVTTNNATNWLYGHNYLGNAPSNGSGAEISSNGRFYNSVSTGTAMHVRRSGSAGAATNAYTALFENSYGDHSWGIVAEFRVGESGGGDRPSILFSNGYNSTTWSVGFGGADDQFRIKQNHGWRNQDWGTERFRIDTGGTPYFNGNVALHAGNYTNYTLPLSSGNASLYLDNSGIHVSNPEATGSDVRIGAAWGKPGIYSNSNITVGSESNILFWISGSQKAYLDSAGRFFSYQGAVNQTTDWAANFRNTPTSGRAFNGDLSAGGPQGTWWFVDSMRHSNSSNYWGTQIAYGWEDNANEIWQRNVSGNNFSGWVRYLNSSNYSSYALPLSGGTMSGAITMGGNNVNNAGQFSLNNGFTISQGGANYGQFSSWVYLPGSYGFYSNVNGAHFYPNDGSYGAWKINGARNGWNGIEFTVNNGNVVLMVNSGSNTTGFHNNSYGWQFQWSDGTAYVSKNSYGGGTSAAVLDSVNYTNYVYPRANTYPQANTPGSFVTPSGGVSGATNGWSALDGYGAVVPNYAGSDWWVGVWTGGNSDRGIQIAGGYSDADLWFRKGAGGWNSWIRLLNSSNYSSYALPLSGGTVTGTTRIGNLSIGYGTYLNSIRPTGDTNLNLDTPSGATYATNIYIGGNQVLHAGNSTSYDAYRASGQGGYPHAGWGMFAFYNWGGSNGGASAPSSSSYTVGLSVGSHPGDQAYGFQIARNMWNTGLWTRGYDSGWGSWVRLLDSSNYSEYALPLGGGTLTGGITLGSFLKIATDNSDWSTGNYFRGASNHFVLGVQSGGTLYLNYGNDAGTTRISGTTLVNGNQVLHAGNYTSYSPSLTGSGASGTWGINVTGRSAALTVQDTRSSVTGPNTGAMQVRADFVANGTDGLGDGGGYHGVLTFQQWGDSSGGGTRQLGFTDNNNLWIRGSGSGLTSYGSWKQILDSGNVGSYAIPLGNGSCTTYTFVTFGAGFSSSNTAYFTNTSHTVSGTVTVDQTNNASASLNSVNFAATQTFASKTYNGLSQYAAKRHAKALAASGGTFGTNYGYLVDEIYVGGALNAYTVLQQDSWAFVSSYATGSLNRHFYAGASSIGPGSSQYDNLMSAGSSTARYTIVYATTGTINTSDVNEKEQIQDLDAAERRVAVAVKGLIKKFKWKDAVAKKGDAARIHIGVIAQEVEAAFVAEGLDPERYALFCKDVWWEKMVPNENYGREDAPNEPEMILETFKSEVEGGTRKERKGIRYDQLLAFVISAI